MQILAKLLGNKSAIAVKQFLTNNVYVQGRNFLDTLDIDVFKLNASDEVEFDVQVNVPILPVATTNAASKDYVDNTIAGALLAANAVKSSITLVPADIVNQYFDLPSEAVDATVDIVVGGVIQRDIIDYTLSVVGLITRVTFAPGGDLATGGAAELVDTDVVYYKYIGV